MQGSWLGIGIMAVVVIVGVVIGCKQSGTRSQLRATILAFVALIAVIIAFCGIVIVASQRWAAPACAVASIVVPLIVYLVAMAIPARRHNRENSVAQGVRKSVNRKDLGSRRNEGTRSPALEFTAVNPVVAPSLNLNDEALLVDWDATDFAEQDEEAIDFAEETEFDFESDMEAAIEAEYEPGQVAEFEQAFEPEPEPEEAPESEPATERPLEPTAFDPSQYFEKATSLRNKGLFEIAAQLYAECAELAEDRATFRKATIEQIACYVKADKLDEAQSLAAALRESASDLTAVEAVKVDAVLRTAER